MSRAFTKETAESAPPPERMVEDGPNPVTPEGMRQIETHVARLEEAMKSESNVLLRETMARDLRYWTVRKANAEVVQPQTPAQFGVRLQPSQLSAIAAQRTFIAFVRGAICGAANGPVQLFDDGGSSPTLAYWAQKLREIVDRRGRWVVRLV